MAACASCNALPPRGSLSNATSTFFGTLAAMTLSASGAAPTPLFHQYQEGLADAALLTIAPPPMCCACAGSAHDRFPLDHVGRRPVILAALAMNMSRGRS